MGLKEAQRLARAAERGELPARVSPHGSRPARQAGADHRGQPGIGLAVARALAATLALNTGHAAGADPAGLPTCAPGGARGDRLLDHRPAPGATHRLRRRRGRRDPARGDRRSGTRARRHPGERGQPRVHHVPRRAPGTPSGGRIRTTSPPSSAPSSRSGRSAARKRSPTWSPFPCSPTEPPWVTGANIVVDGGQRYPSARRFRLTSARKIPHTNPHPPHKPRTHPHLLARRLPNLVDGPSYQ